MTREQMFAFAAVFSGQLQAAIRGAEEHDLPILAAQMDLLPQLLTPATGGRWTLVFEPEPEPAVSGATPENP